MSKSETENLLVRSHSDALRDFFNIGKVKKIVRVGTDIFSVVAPAVEKPTALNILKAGFNVCKIIIDDLEVWPEDFFDETWEQLYNEDFTKIILKALHGKPYNIIKTSDETMLIHIVYVGDTKFSYMLNTKTDRVDRIYVKGDKIEKSKSVIKDELWKMMKDSNIILRVPRLSPGGSVDSSLINLEIDDVFQPMPSKRSDEYSTYLKKCIDAGVSRSVMLYGPPGTGKSTMARTIVSNLGMRSLRIRVEDFGRIDSSTIFDAISIFEPDAVILDDFDRSSSQNTLLEILEFFQKHVKLVISTVNNKNSLDEAILRPGRFDELLQIKQMDEDVIKSILGDEHASEFEFLKNWPVAFIHEYVKRLRFMKSEEARESVKELARRVKKLSSYDDEDDIHADCESKNSFPPQPTQTSHQNFSDPLKQTSDEISIIGSFRNKWKKGKFKRNYLTSN